MPSYSLQSLWNRNSFRVDGAVLRVWKHLIKIQCVQGAFSIRLVRNVWTSENLRGTAADLVSAFDWLSGWDKKARHLAFETSGSVVFSRPGCDFLGFLNGYFVACWISSIHFGELSHLGGGDAYLLGSNFVFSSVNCSLPRILDYYREGTVISWCYLNRLCTTFRLLHFCYCRVN